MVRRDLVLAGRYRLEEPLGRGGMGEVWRATDQRLRRPVAVKILPLTVAAEPSTVARFRREAEVSATLNHPGITTVFDVDEYRDGDEHWLFLVMELLVGRDLRHLITANPAGLPIERVRDLAAQITEAMAAAHRNSVIHRDIKPANLFLLDEGRIKICDFGIARLADATRITTTGSATGTPLYMAPEQIQAGQVDHRTDLYAFGCVLYELLTGTTWIQADSNIAAILYQHLNQPPAPPTSVRAGIPNSLDTLVLDLLAKQPGDRPHDAATVTRRLREPVTEPPPSTPAFAPPEPAGTTAATAPPTRRQPRIARPAPATSAPEQPSPSPVRRRIGRRTLILGGLGAAAVIGVPTTWLMLEDEDDRTIATLTGHTGTVEAVAFSPAGTTLATSGTDNTVRLWDLTTYDPTATLTIGRISDGLVGAAESVAFSPDGKTLATSDDNTVRLWDVATHHTTATLTGAAIPVAFSPDGRTLATGSADYVTVRLRDASTHHATATLAKAESVAFSPDGKTLAITDGNTVRLWEVATHRTTATLKGHTGEVTSMAFSPDGTTLATGSTDDTVRLWDLATHRTTVTLTGATNWVTSVAFSPDGKTLATARAGDHYYVRLWDVTTHRIATTLKGHADTVTSMAFSPDGTTLATGSDDTTIRLWKVT